jgi:outer membrane biosynthesis protein TonB
MASLDLRQQAMRNPAGNAGLSGEISLSTTAWEYAPWLQAFRRAVMERWLPPAAYRMGLIDGWVRARVEIARDGSLLGVQVLEQDVGNPSLTDAVVYALRAPAPYHKLPSNFPDPSLTLTIRFVYPPVKER